MAKTYTESELISFGEHLLSEEREKSLKVASKEKNIPGYTEVKRKVFHTDLENWKNLKHGSA